VETYRPRIVVIEYNAALPAGRRLAQPAAQTQSWDGTDFFGSSLEALCWLAEHKGYRLVHTELAALDAFFVRSDLTDGRFPAPAHVPRRHEPNYFLTGYRHPPDTQGRDYLDLAVPATEEDAESSSRPSVDWHAITALPTRESPETVAARTDFIWHQKFELAPGVYTPGTNDVQRLLDAAGIPERLDGATVLDIGTTNGGAAFACERRGAARVVAVDIADEDWFGFAAIKACLGSRAEHLQASVYELPEVLGERFDVVLFWGVLYHLRHPLLALDNVRRLSRGNVSIETAVCDYELAEHRHLPLVRFYRGDELAADSSNWFAPTVAALADWCHSCGLDPVRIVTLPEEATPVRAMVQARVIEGEPEYLALSHERALSCIVGTPPAPFGR
jgi:tRNA (mo5U34)-methyltransferase